MVCRPQKPISDRGIESSPGGNDWWAEAVHAYSAWSIVDNLKNVNAPTIGLIDTGVDNTHEDLSKTVIFPIDYSKNSYKGVDYHGTHVAGILAANSNNLGIRGISDKSKILSVDYDSHPYLSNMTNNTMIANGKYIEALKTLIDQNARVINNSWGSSIFREDNSDYLPFLKQVYYDSLDIKPSRESYEKYLEIKENESNETAISCICAIASLLDSSKKNKEFLICQSAGNGYAGAKNAPIDASCNGFFSNINEKTFNKMPSATRQKLEKRGITCAIIKDHILIVGAAENTKESQNSYKASSFSNYGNTVEIYAPGTSIYSTLPDNKYDNKSGTSMACPIVAGAAAVLWTVAPDLTSREVKSILVNSKTMDVKENVTGSLKPMLDIRLALKNVLGDNYEEPASEYTSIYTASDLNKMRNNLFGKYILMNDIDLSAIDNWAPIGDSTKPFTGTFDGNGHSISNMNVSVGASGKQYAGLFGYTDKAVIRNIGNLTGTIKSNDSSQVFAGGIAGSIIQTVISNCKTNVSIVLKHGVLSGVPVTSGSAEEYLVAGGIVGEAATWQPQKGAPNASTISKCSTYGNIEIISDRIIAVTGGIAGVVATYSSDSTHSLLLENCYSACNLNVKTDVAGTVMGGIIGGADRGIKELSVINCASNCKYTWSTGKVEGLEADYIGGIAGMMGETPNVKVAKCSYDSSDVSKAFGFLMNVMNSEQFDVQGCSEAEIKNSASALGVLP